MATGRTPGSSGISTATPTARLNVDLSQFQRAPRVAREAARATEREISQAFRAIAAEQRRAQTEAQQTLTVLRTAQAQVTATARAESTERIQVARAESVERQQEARRVAAVAIEQERRQTAAMQQETRRRQSMRGALGQGLGAFAGTAFGGPLGGIAGGLAAGSPAIAAGLALGQAARTVQNQAAISVQAASDITESINKAGVAFEESQQQILNWSRNSATALGQSRQQALEAVSSFGLLFRTIGIAPVESAKMSEALVQLAADIASINNISADEALEKLRAGLVGEIRPLREVGVLLEDTRVNAKALELGLANTTAAVTQQDKVMARYQLILEQTVLTQGDFARTSNEAANLQRILMAQVKDFHAELGQSVLPGYIIVLQGATTAMRGLNRAAETGTGIVEKYGRAWQVVSSVIGAMGQGMGFGAALTTIPLTAAQMAGIEQSDRLMISRGMRMAPSEEVGLSPEQLDLSRERATELRDLDRETNRARIDATERYEAQRTETITRYERTIAREAEDFGRQRARAEREFAASIVDIREDAARREAKQTEELMRANARARADTDERIADLREDATKRLTELEEDYQRDRERAAAQHRDNLLSAASRLDARAVAEEQRRFARESMDAAEAHEEQRSDLRDSLDERIRDEEEALEKSNRLRQENYDRQIQEQRENDERRIQDMRDDFEERKRIEDEDRAIRLGRMAQDHNDQLAEQDRQHGLRIAQILRHAREERELINEEFRKALLALGGDIQRWAESLRRTFAPLPSTGGAARGLPEMTPSFQHGGPVLRTGPAFLHQGEFVFSRQMLSQGTGPSNMTVNIAVNGAGSDGMGIAIAVRQEMESLLRRVGRR